MISRPAWALGVTPGRHARSRASTHPSLAPEEANQLPVAAVNIMQGFIDRANAKMIEDNKAQIARNEQFQKECHLMGAQLETAFNSRFEALTLHIQENALRQEASLQAIAAVNEKRSADQAAQLANLTDQVTSLADLYKSHVPDKNAMMKEFQDEIDKMKVELKKEPANISSASGSHQQGSASSAPDPNDPYVIKFDAPPDYTILHINSERPLALDEVGPAIADWLDPLFKRDDWELSSVTDSELSDRCLLQFLGGTVKRPKF